MSNKIYHFVGIKGTGMSAMALILNDRGEKVQGSDIDQYTFTQRGLEQAGIEVLPFDEANIKEGLTIIAGNSFTDDHPEIKKALEMGLEVYRYHDFLGQMIKGKTSIGVAGAHGKTSTSGLLAHVLSGISPTDYLVGDGSGKGVPNARFFVYEADEYRRHFLATAPEYAIITNIDFDHPDYYESLDDVKDAFTTFANQAQKGLFAWGDDPSLREMKTNAPIYYYGFKDTDDIQAVDIKRTTSGSSFHVIYDGKDLGEFKVPMFGEHNILNSLAVIALAYFEDIDLDEIRKELLTFQGVKRRFSERTLEDMIIIDDYAHHPSEIKATLDAARQEHPNKQLIVVFQPHTFTRTIALMDDFAESLNLADKVFLTDIYSSPRESSGNVSSADLAKKITKGGEVLAADNMSPLLDFHDDVVIFMGAGDIQKYEQSYEELLSHLSNKTN